MPYVTVYGQVVADSAASSDAGQEDGWVVCRVFKKKHHLKDSSGSGGGKHGHHHHGGAGDHGHGSSKAAAAAHGLGLLQYSSSDDALDQILQYMGRSCKQEHELLSPPQGRPGGGSSTRYLRPIDTALGGHGFMKLPPLELSPELPPSAPKLSPPPPRHEPAGGGNNGITDWAMVDRLVASHLNGQPDAPASDHQLCSFDGLDFYSTAATKLLGGGGGASGSDDDDLWTFARSASSTSTTTELLNHGTL